MTTIFTISTKNFPRTTVRRCVLGVVFLLVMVGLQSCRSAVSTQSSVALNTYQTPHTLSAGGGGFRLLNLGFTSSLGATLQPQKIEFAPAVMMGLVGFDVELGLGKGWDIGCMARLDANFLDASASVRPYAKFRFTEDNAPLTAALLFGSEFVQGSSSNSSEIYKPIPIWGPDPSNLVYPILTNTIITTSVRSLSSSAFRIFVSVPIIFAKPKYASTTFIVHPGLHYWQQRITQSDTLTTTSYGSMRTGIPQSIISEIRSTDSVSRYLIPSISLSLSGGQVFNVNFQPELTLALTREDILWNFGISLQLGKFGEEQP